MHGEYTIQDANFAKYEASKSHKLLKKYHLVVGDKNNGRVESERRRRFHGLARR